MMKRALSLVALIGMFLGWVFAGATVGGYTVTFRFYAPNGTVLNNVTVTYNETSVILNSGDSLILAPNNYTFVFSKEGFQNRTLESEIDSNVSILVVLYPIEYTPLSDVVEAPTVNWTAENASQLFGLDSNSILDVDPELFQFALEFNTEGLLQELLQGYIGMVIALMLTSAATIASLLYHKHPPTTLAVNAVLITFFNTYLERQIGMMYNSLAIILFVVITWNFTKRMRGDIT